LVRPQDRTEQEATPCTSEASGKFSSVVPLAILTGDRFIDGLAVD
jgi:hypothetical protein